MSFIKLHEKNNFFFLVLFFTIFCSFNFIPVISAEIQPIIGIVLLLIGTCKVIATMKCNDHILYIMLFMFAMIFPLMVGLSKSYSAIVMYVLYLIGPIIFYYFLHNSYSLKVKYLYIFVGIFLVVSFIQAFSPSAIHAQVNPVLDMIIKRARLGFYGDMRGVGVFYSEPAHAAKYIYTLFVFCIVLKYCSFCFDKEDQKINKTGFYYIIFALIFVSYLNKSASLYFLCLVNIIIFILLYALNFNTRKLIYVLLLLPLVWLFFYIIINYYEFYDTSRIGSMIDSYQRVKDNFTLTDLQYFGSIRSISVISGYAGVYFYPFGVGLGQGEKEIFDVMSNIGFDLNMISFLTNQEVDSLKPNSYVSQILFESGVIGLLICSIFLYNILRLLKISNLEQCIFSSIVLTSLFQILFFSTTTLPAPWLLLGVGVYGLKKQGVN